MWFYGITHLICGCYDITAENSYRFLLFLFWLVKSCFYHHIQKARILTQCPVSGHHPCDPRSHLANFIWGSTTMAGLGMGESAEPQQAWMKSERTAPKIHIPCMWQSACTLICRFNFSGSPWTITPENLPSGSFLKKTDFIMLSSDFFY